MYPHSAPSHVRGLPVMNIPTIPKLPAKGLCESCMDADDCPMVTMLPIHLDLVKEYNTWHYEDIDPASWDTYAIDLPTFTDDFVEWCPMHAISFDIVLLRNTD